MEHSRQADREIQKAEELLERADEYISLTVKEYARRERIHPITVYRQIQNGDIKGVVRHGRAIRIRLRKRLFTHLEALSR
jgi:hypothetical protein